MKISRYIEPQVKKALTPGRVVVVLGARQVGKTTLIKKVIQETDIVKDKITYFDCDAPEIKRQLDRISLAELSQLLAPFELVVFDEVQNINQAGLMLKLIADHLPEKKVLVSGSSSLELTNKLSEPLTGRKRTFYLYPISLLELWSEFNYDQPKLKALLPQFLRFGLYPRVLNLPSPEEKREHLLELTEDYLYRDVLNYQLVKNPLVLRKLLQALALQIGQQVSILELANLVDIDRKTVLRYLDLLEKSYVVFSLPSLSRNLRKEISKSRKIYFWDLGVRNALIRNFGTFDVRSDIGQVWENFMVVERLKRNQYKKEFKNYYFWRTYDQKEVDLIEEADGKFLALEFKWQNKKVKTPKLFLQTYPNSEFSVVTQDNFLDWVV